MAVWVSQRLGYNLKREREVDMLILQTCNINVIWQVSLLAIVMLTLHVCGYVALITHVSATCTSASSARAS